MRTRAEVDAELAEAHRLREEGGFNSPVLNRLIDALWRELVDDHGLEAPRR
jgi:hypothetical protein